MSEPLHIAHVTTESGFSGGETQVFLTMEGLRQRGHRLHLFCPPGSRSADEAERRGIKCTRVRMRNDFDVAAALALRRAFRHGRFDIVHLHTGRANWLGGLAACMAGLAAVSTRRMDRRVKRGWRTRLIYGRFVRRAIAISPAVRDCLCVGGVDPARIRLVYEAVDPARVQASSAAAVTRATLGASEEDRILLVLAALIPRKGVDVLLEAMGILAAEGVRPLLWIAGDGPQRDALRSQAAALGVQEQVRFLGQRGDAADLLAACDVFVLPSRREGLGVAALEAMAAGRPVVCSAVGGLQTSVVEGRTGLLVPAGEPTALADALQRVLRDEDLRKRLGDAGPTRIAEGFEASQMVDAHVDLYREVLDERGRRSSSAAENGSVR
jgi:glycosyltransferase involved in cell wall biosynthesis